MTDDSPDTLIEMVESARWHDDSVEAGRVCAQCGYRDPSVCAMTCPSCDTPHPDVGTRSE